VFIVHCTQESLLRIGFDYDTFVTIPLYTNDSLSRACGSTRCVASLQRRACPIPQQLLQVIPGVSAVPACGAFDARPLPDLRATICGHYFDRTGKEGQTYSFWCEMKVFAQTRELREGYGQANRNKKPFSQGFFTFFL
jgi:hypothetical protein